MHHPSTLLFIAATAVVGCGDAMGGGGSAAAPGTDGRNVAVASDAATPDAATLDEPASGMETGAIDTGAGDAGSDGDTGPDAAHLPPPCVSGGQHAGSRWQDLYACYFGPTGIANCALNTTCHVSGMFAAGTWVCGPSPDLCYQGLISSSVVPDGGPTPASMARLYTSLRTSDGNGGLMPLEPADVSFTPEDMARIMTWIQSGAANN